MNYPVFGRRTAPLPRLSVERPKKRDRELGHRWAVTAKGFNRKHPFCAECQRHGRDVPANVVDHIIPREHGGPLFERWNLQSLCHHCHNGIKRELERLAVEMGDVQILVGWMRQPETRPGRYAFITNAVED